MQATPAPSPWVQRVSIASVPLLLLAATASAQGIWSLVPQTSAPLPRQSARMMALDTANDRLVLFGGSSGATSFLGDTHTFACSTGAWTQVTGPAPAARYGHSLTCDAARNEVILFGGRLFNGNGQLSNETWAFVGNSWQQRSPLQAPAPRWLHSTTYDSTRNVIVLFGGGWSTTTSDTWEWNGTTWTQRATTIPSPNPLRAGSAIAYDPVRQRTVIFGGSAGSTFLGGTLIWDGATWTNVTPVAGPNPPNRSAANMVYHPGFDRIVLFGGYAGTSAANYLNDTWYWDGSAWTQVFPGVTPTQRASAPMAFDPLRERVLSFGGNLTGVHFNELWEFQSAAPARLRSFGQGCAGGVPSPTLDPADHRRPWLGDSYALRIGGLPTNGLYVLVSGTSDSTWNGVPLPLPLDVLGLTGCLAQVSLDVLDAAVQSGNAVVTFPLPNLTAFAGISFFHQALVLHPGAGNPFGGLVSNGVEAVLGWR